MSDNQHKALGRKVVLLNKSKKKLNKAQSIANLRSGRESRKDDAGISSPSPKDGQSAFHGTPRRISDKDPVPHQCFTEICKQGRVKPNRRRFTMPVIAMAMALYLISGPAYEFLRNFFPMPSRQTLYFRTSFGLRFNATQLGNVSFIKNVVDNYRDENNVTDEEIYGILAVDAISLDKEMIITKDGLVYGGIESEVLSKEALTKIQTHFQELEQLWRNKSSVIISDAFVFQFQPVIATFRPFVVHIAPSTQGKATQEHVGLLEEISKRLSEHRIMVIGYSMDGDSTYRKLHDRFYTEYEETVRSDNRFVNFSKISSCLIVSDPLHILKRARYRLLGSIVHAGLTNSTEAIDADALAAVLNLPSKVFSSQKFTKMHDDLPISLFSFESLVHLADEKPVYLAYFLPFCLLNIGLSEKGLSIEERINFLEVAFYYVLAYLGELKEKPSQLPDVKTARNAHVKLFPQNLALEMTNTLASILSVMYSFNGTIHLNRIGTNPLEHTFGAIRMRSRHKNTYQKLVKSVGDMETWKKMVSVAGTGGKISGRRSYYGQLVSTNISFSPCVLNMNPRDIAVAAHMIYGLPISSKELDCWNMNFVSQVACDVFTEFVSTLRTIYRRLYPKDKTISTRSRSILVTSGRGILCNKKRIDLS